MRDPKTAMDRRAALKAVGGTLALAAAPLFKPAVAQTTAHAPAAPAKRSGPTLTAVVSDYAAQTAFNAMPTAVREQTKKVIFDEIASSYFGRRSAAGSLIVSFITELGGASQARLWGTDLRVPRPFAALANGTAGHGDEVDGAHVVGGHPGATIVHAAAAIGDGQRISGAELINSVALGYDIGIRLVEACGGKFLVRDTKHLTSDFLYSLGAAAAAARLMRLNTAQYGAAFALTTFQANGLYALYAEKSHISKSFCAGQYAYAGVSSALMAKVGMEGHDDILGSEYGLYAAWGDGKNREAITRELGSTFKILGANFKFFNAGYPIHTAVEAATTLIRTNKIAAERIAGIVVGMPEGSLRTVDNRDMHNISVQDMVCASIASGGLKLVDRPFPEMLSNPTYRRLRSLITAQVDAELNREFPNGRGARVTITTTDGSRFSLRVDNPRGHSLRGEVTWKDLADKWTHSLDGCNVPAALELAEKMEKLEDVNTLFDAFKGVNKQA